MRKRLRNCRGSRQVCVHSGSPAVDVKSWKGSRSERPPRPRGTGEHDQSRDNVRTPFLPPTSLHHTLHLYPAEGRRRRHKGHALWQQQQGAAPGRGPELVRRPASDRLPGRSSRRGHVADTRASALRVRWRDRQVYSDTRDGPSVSSDSLFFS